MLRGRLAVRVSGTAGLVNYGKRKFPWRTGRGAWKESAWQVGRCWEILHRGDGSVKTRGSQQTPRGDSVVSRSKRQKRKKKSPQHFFQILPIQLNPQGPCCTLSWCLSVSHCSQGILSELRLRNTTSVQCIALLCYVRSSISCLHWGDWVCRWTSMDVTITITIEYLHLLKPPTLLDAIQSCEST